MNAHFCVLIVANPLEHRTIGGGCANIIVSLCVCVCIFIAYSFLSSPVSEELFDFLKFACASAGLVTDSSIHHHQVQHIFHFNTMSFCSEFCLVFLYHF